MQLSHRLTTLGRNDVRLIGRDSFLSGLLMYVLVTAVFMRFALPWLHDAVAANPDFTFKVSDFYPLIVGYIVLFLGAAMAGMMIGFVLLDERDDNTIKALLVTPMPIRHYLAYRLGVPMLLATGIIIFEILVMNQALVPLWQIILLALAASLIAPCITLILATFAENKVQGFAMLKMISSSGLIILAAWFVPEPFQFLFGIFPPYWIVKAYWLAFAGNDAWWICLLIGVIMLIGTLFWLSRRFEKVAYR